MKIIDNFLNKEELLNLQNLYTSNEFPWCYQAGIDSIDTKRNDFFFCHMLYNHNIPKSNYFSSIAPIFSKLDNFKSLIRVKANLTTKKNENFKAKMHVDTKIKNSKTAVFYCNTNNGATLFEDGNIITSEENKIVTFESDRMHCGTDCTNKNIRIVINFNYLD